MTLQAVRSESKLEVQNWKVGMKSRSFKVNSQKRKLGNYMSFALEQENVQLVKGSHEKFPSLYKCCLLWIYKR